MLRLQKWLAAVRGEVELRDLFVFGGLAGVVFGTAQVYAPAGWIVGGATLFWLGLRRG